MTLKVLYEFLLKSYGQYHFFFQKLKKTILENTKEEKRKLKISKNGIPPANRSKKLMKVQKLRQKVSTSSKLKSYEQFHLFLHQWSLTIFENTGEVQLESKVPKHWISAKKRSKEWNLKMAS